MRSATLLVGALTLVGCDAIGTSETGSTVVYPPAASTSCPSGMSPARDSELVLLGFNYDGLSWTIGHGTFLMYDGASAACISADGRSARLLLEAGGDYVGSLFIEAAAPGTYNFTDAPTEAYFELELDGFDPATSWPMIGETYWQTGNMSVTSVDPLELGIGGTGYVESHFLTFSFNILVQR